MNVSDSTSQAYSLANDMSQAQQAIGLSLRRLSSGSSVVSSNDSASASTSAQGLSDQEGGVQAATLDVLDSLSSAQTADGYLGDIQGALTQMGSLANSINNGTSLSSSDIAQYSEEFKSLQSQLRSTIGGTTSQIGGSTDVGEPKGSYGGAALFGSSVASNVDSQGEGSSGAVGTSSLDLQQGATAAVISQDGAGSFTLSASDPDAVTVISNALEQVGAAQAANSAAVSGLQLQATSLQVEHHNLASVMSTVAGPEMASVTALSAITTITANAGEAMLAQANVDPSAADLVLNT